MGVDLFEDPVDPYWKDYDLVATEHPALLASRFDTTDWGVFAAYTSHLHVGGAIVARNTPGFESMGASPTSAILLDMRVHPNSRRRGIGKLLFVAAADWAQSNGCSELLVETQDTNVTACRFYRDLGFDLALADTNGYAPYGDEARLIWRLSFSAGVAT
jgi:GNAT superfamily N-acetyltransferase